MSKIVSPEQRILAAARSTYLKSGVENTGMGDIAEAAGIARSTLYRYFPTRDEVLVAVIRTDMMSMAEFMQDRLARVSDPADHIVEGLVLAIEEIPRQPLLNQVFAGDNNSRARRLVWNSPAIVELGNQLMQDVIGPALAGDKLNRQVKPEVLVEWVYRTLLSFLTLPSNTVKGRRELRATLHALLIPVLLN
jgi:AcrR family transcriptional regulator